MKVPQDSRAQVSESILLMQEVMDRGFLDMISSPEARHRDKARTPELSAPNKDRLVIRPEDAWPSEMERIRR